MLSSPGHWNSNLCISWNFEVARLSKRGSFFHPKGEVSGGRFGDRNNKKFAGNNKKVPGNDQTTYILKITTAFPFSSGSLRSPPKEADMNRMLLFAGCLVLCAVLMVPTAWTQKSASPRTSVVVFDPGHKQNVIGNVSLALAWGNSSLPRRNTSGDSST